MSGGAVAIVSKPPIETHSQTRGDRGNRAPGLATDSIPHSTTEPPAYPSDAPSKNQNLGLPLFLHTNKMVREAARHGVRDVAQVTKIKRHVISGLGDQDDILTQGVRNSCLVEHVCILSGQVANHHTTLDLQINETTS